jgi:hypothetical protein
MNLGGRRKYPVDDVCRGLKRFEPRQHHPRAIYRWPHL